MSDFDTRTYNNSLYSGGSEGEGSESHSRQSSRSSGLSYIEKENQLKSYSSVEGALDNSSETDLILMKGTELLGESTTETAYDNIAMTNGNRYSKPVQDSGYSAAGTAKAKAAKSPYTAGPITSIPEEEITIPADGNLTSFTADQMASFFRSLRVDARIIAHLHKKAVDGRRFSKLKDSELEALGVLKNPVVVYFREKSQPKKVKVKGQWRL